MERLRALPSSKNNAQPLASPRSSQCERTELANAAMRRYAAGDDSAFNELYRLLAPRLSRHCRWLCGRRDADELMQEVFLKMHRARASFVDTGSVVAWAFAIARTTHLDQIRYRKRRHETLTEAQRLEVHPADDDTRPDHAAIQRHFRAELTRQLAQLSENLRSAYVLVKVDGLDCESASAELGISIDATKQRVHRAALELKAGLAELMDAS